MKWCTMGKHDGISDEIERAHSRIAEAYGTIPIDGELNPASYAAWNIDRNVVQPLMEIYQKCNPWHCLLDAGCGNGQIAHIFSQLDIPGIVGVDFSYNMLKTANIRARRGGYASRFLPVMARLESLACFHDNRFDAAFLFGVMEHLDDPRPVFRELYRVIKPHGVMIVAVPRKFSLSFFSYILFGDSPRRWGKKKTLADTFRYREKLKYYRFYTPSEVLGMITALPHARLIDKIPFAHFHLDGFPGIVLSLLGKSRTWGHHLLDSLDFLSRKLKCVPSGEFWVIRKLD